MLQCVRHTVSYWSTYGSDDSLAGYQATAVTTEELTAATDSGSRHRNRVEEGRAARATRTFRRDVELIVTN